MTRPTLTLFVLRERLAVCRLAPDAPVPAWALGPTSGFRSVTHTPEELSLVCAEEHVPASVTAERGWRGLRVAGPLAFSLTGVLAALAQPLAEAGVPIFTLSTYDTDYVLVKETDLNRALSALRDAGHRISE
jgi:hypothetical protein